MSRAFRPPTSPPSTTISILRCISSAGPVIPVPGIAAAVEAVISILDVVESVRTSRKECLSLAEKAAQLVLSLHTEASNIESESATYKNLETNIEPFRVVLKDIQKYTSKITKLTWAKQALKRKEISMQIQELSRSLEDCYQNFQITSFVRLQMLIAQFQDEHSITFDKLCQELSALRHATIKASENSALRLTSEIQQLETLINEVDHQKCDVQKTHRLLQKIALNTNTELQHDTAEYEWVITLRELAPIRVHVSRTNDHAGVTLAKYRNENVIVKRFYGVKNFMEERHLWKEIWHPYLPQLIGHSSQSEKAPFIVLRGDFIRRDIKSYIHVSLEKNTIAGLLNGLEILYGITSAINYLRTENILTKTELSELMQPRNILLSSHNRVILGERLLSRVESNRKVPECHRGAVMDVYLASVFFDICLEILVPRNGLKFMPLEVNGTQCPFSILRLLLSFTAIGTKSKARTMSQVATRIERAWLRLNELNQTIGQLTFSEVRQVFLRMDDLVHSRTYTPLEDWDISPGDIGYVRNGKFIRLENILDVSGFSVNETEVIQIICDPPRPFSKEVMENGWIRYEFTAPSYAWYYHAERRDIDEAEALRHLIAMAPEYLEKYQEHSLALTDLILVTDKPTMARRWAEFSYHSLDDGNDNPPEKVYFFLRIASNDTSVEAWGYWSINPTWFETPTGSASNITDPQIKCGIASYQRTFEFVQLEKNDVSFSIENLK